MVILMAALFVCVQAGQGLGENAAFGLFLGRVNVNRLPYMYMGLGGFVSLASLVYATSLSRFVDSSVVKNLLAISVFVFAGQWAAITIFGLSFYSLLWLTTYGMGILSGTVLWTIAGAVCDARQAKRLFPLFTSMGILGSVFGNLLTGLFANIVGTENLIILYAVLLAAGFYFTRDITRLYFRAEKVEERKYSILNDLRAGFDFVRGSQLFRLVAFSSILYSILFFTVDFPFSEILSLQFQGNEASLAGFKGVFTSVTTAVTFLVSLLLANRLYGRLGIINSILIMPVTYAVAFLIFFASFSFTGAVFVRFAQLAILGGLLGTAWNALFNVVPPEQRGPVLAFNNGVPAQLGVFLSGALILLSKQALETKDILLLGAFVAVISIYLTLKMKPAYGEALLNALRAGRADVFSDQDESFAGYQNDPAAMQVIHNALRDPKPHIRRLAVEMSARTGTHDIIADLIDRLYDDDGSVRAAATRAVSDLGGHAALADVILGLDDPEEIVRAETLAALPKLDVDPSPELLHTLERLLRDEDDMVRAHAALVLLYFGENPMAKQTLDQMLKHKDVAQRQRVLRAFGHIASGIKHPIRLEREWMQVLQDESLIVRREAAQVARFVRNESVIEFLGRLLADDDAAVRRNTSESLKQLWPDSRNVVLPMLEHAGGPVVYAALDAIPAGDEGALQALSRYIQHEVSNLRYLRSLIAPFTQPGPFVVLLAEALKRRESQSEERLIKAVGLFGNARALNLIRKTLNAGDASTRASALEALETLGDRKITQQVLPILDRGGVFMKSEEDAVALQTATGLLLEHEDHWIRALAARAVPELGLDGCVDVLQKLKRDRHDLVRQAASAALTQLEGEKMKTLKTLSTMERILLLREVPMFAGLDPEDLGKIADVAHEELYAANGLICREGEAGNTLFIIVSGDVQVVKSAAGRENLLATRTTGEFVGEMAILESAPRSATVRAMNDVRVLSIDGDAFTSILLDRPEVAISVLRNMSTRIRALNAMVGSG